MKTIATVAPPDIRMIDLTRSLKLPHGSLTPGIDPEPRWRIEARQAGDEFTGSAIMLFAAFVLLTAIIMGYYFTA
jgi:hypothetical protein